MFLKEGLSWFWGTDAAVRSVNVFRSDFFNGYFLLGILFFLSVGYFTINSYAN